MSVVESQSLLLCGIYQRRTRGRSHRARIDGVHRYPLHSICTINWPHSQASARLSFVFKQVPCRAVRPRHLLCRVALIATAPPSARNRSIDTIERTREMRSSHLNGRVARERRSQKKPYNRCHYNVGRIGSLGLLCSYTCCFVVYEVNIHKNLICWKSSFVL